MLIIIAFFYTQIKQSNLIISKKENLSNEAPVHTDEALTGLQRKNPHDEMINKSGIIR